MGIGGVSNIHLIKIIFRAGLHEILTKPRNNKLSSEDV